jgi:hypothetical protein
MKITYISSIVLIQTVFFTTVRAQVEPCLTNPIFSDTCCPIVMNEILPEACGDWSKEWQRKWDRFHSCGNAIDDFDTTFRILRNLAALL